MNEHIAAISKLYANWRTAVEAGDIAGYVKGLHDDIRMMPPGAANIVGVKQYAAFLEPVFASATYTIEIAKPAVIEVVGDVAVTEYEYVVHLHLKDPGQGISEPGALTASRTATRFFDVLRRRTDGSWAVWRHTWNASADA